jgi:hypothetical protein
VLGDFAEASALATTQYRDVEVETRAGVTRQTRTTPDHLLVQARLVEGAPLSIEVVGGRPPEATPFPAKRRNSCSMAARRAASNPGGFASRSTAPSHRSMRPRPRRCRTRPPTSRSSTRLRDDIHRGTTIATGFDHALRLARVIEDMLELSRAGARKSARGWPERQ